MCGRYAASTRPEDLVEEFEVDAGPEARPGEALAADYNVAPTKDVHAVLTRPLRRADTDADPDAAADEPVRQLRVVRWGLVPSWAKDTGIGSRLINARVESVHEKPAFRKAFAARRCLLPADGYYEWYGDKGRKQPFFIRPRDGGVLAMAGLYELWRDRSREDDDPARWVWSATVITTTAEDSLGQIHDRMPMLVERERYAAWLDPGRNDAEGLRGLLVPAAPGRLEALPVSTAVNDVRNNGPHLLDPLPVEELDAAPPAEPTLF